MSGLLTSSAGDEHTPVPLVVVVDASIAVKWVLVEKDSDRATAVLQNWIQAGARLIVPPHFFVECAAVLQKRVRRAELSRQEALGLFLSLQATELTIHGDPLLSHQALDASGRYGLASAYDAHYVALAELYHAELWTADERMFNALAGHAPFAHLLREYQPEEASPE